MAYRKLGVDNKHRRSMLATLTKQVVNNESITTTETRAKEVRKTVDKLITYGKKGDLTSRRGRLDSQEKRGNGMKIRAYVPLAEMFGYATALRSNTQGRGTFIMQFNHYDTCPKSIAEEIIKKRS